MQAGKYDVACPQLAESYRLDPAAGTLLNLASCEEKRGRLADAWQAYRDLAQTLSAGDDRLAFVKKQVESLGPRVPRLSLRLAASAPEATKLTRDGVVVGRASQGEPLPVNPGDHVLVVSAPGFRERTVPLTLREGESRDVELAPGDPLAPASTVVAPPPAVPSATLSTSAASPPAAPPRAAEAPSSGARGIGHALVGGGVAALALGAVAGILAVQRRGVVRDHCDPALRCDDDGLKATGDFRTLATASTVAFAIGVAGVGAGGYLLLTAAPASTAQVTFGGRF